MAVRKDYSQTLMRIKMQRETLFAHIVNRNPFTTITHANGALHN